ncbi:MAG: hypothetical protein WEC34_06610 [Acidimicrobiia bacterium]
MDDDDEGSTLPGSPQREGWTELFPFALFAVMVVAAIVAIALT